MAKVKEVNIKAIKGRRIPGTDSYYLITILNEDTIDLSRLQDENTLESKKIYCADCGKLVEKFIQILQIDYKRSKPQSKRVCNSCHEVNYAVSRLQNVNTGMSNCI